MKLNKIIVFVGGFFLLCQLAAPVQGSEIAVDEENPMQYEQQYLEHEYEQAADEEADSYNENPGEDYKQDVPYEMPEGDEDVPPEG